MILFIEKCSHTNRDYIGFIIICYYTHVLFKCQQIIEKKNLRWDSQRVILHFSIYNFIFFGL